jgi:hypothetical protein
MYQLLKNNYLCNVGDFTRQSLHTDTLKSLSSFRAFRFSGEAFFISGSYQILPMPITEKRQNSNLPSFQYFSQKSVSNDLTVSTYDLQVRKKTWLTTHLGICRKGMGWSEKGQSELTN